MESIFLSSYRIVRIARGHSFHPKETTDIYQNRTRRFTLNAYMLSIEPLSSAHLFSERDFYQILVLCITWSAGRLWVNLHLTEPSPHRKCFYPLLCSLSMCLNCQNRGTSSEIQPLQRTTLLHSVTTVYPIIALFKLSQFIRPDLKA